MVNYVDVYHNRLTEGKISLFGLPLQSFSRR